MNVKTKNLCVDAGIMAYIPVPAGYSNHLGLLVQVVPNKNYRLEMETQDEGSWGTRVALSRIVLDPSAPNDESVMSKTGWLLISDPCYVVGDGDDTSILDYEKVFEMRDGAIYEEEHGRWGVTSSGFGDGGYDCTAHVDDTGVLVEATVVFIGDEEDSVDEDDEEE